MFSNPFPTHTCIRLELGAHFRPSLPSLGSADENNSSVSVISSAARDQHTPECNDDEPANRDFEESGHGDLGKLVKVLRGMAF